MNDSMQDFQTKALRDRIGAFLAETGLSATYVGKQAVNNSEVILRILRGRSVELRTAERLCTWMAGYLAKRAEKLSKVSR